MLINKHSLLSMSNHAQWRVLIYQRKVVILMLLEMVEAGLWLITDFINLVHNLLTNAGTSPEAMLILGVWLLGATWVATMPLRS